MNILAEKAKISLPTEKFCKKGVKDVEKFTLS